MSLSPRTVRASPGKPKETAVEVMKIRIPSPIGDIGVELHDKTAVSVIIGPRGHEKRRFLPFSKLPDTDFLDELYGRFSEFFAGARPSPGLDYDLGPSGISTFARRVLKETAKVPYGRTRTYRKIAVGAGRPNAYRMVLASLVANPIPIIIPCHRIVTNKSGIGSYIGGKEAKKWLLAMEKEGLKA